MRAVYYLSDSLPDHPCDVTCATCGLSQAYTPQELIAELGDQRGPMALQLIAGLNGCERIHNNYRDCCGLVYRYPLGDALNALNPAPSEQDARRRASQARRAHLSWALSEDWPGYTIGTLPLWVELLAACRACYRAPPISRRTLIRLAWSNADLPAIEKRLRCKACGNRVGNRLFLLKAPR